MRKHYDFSNAIKNPHAGMLKDGYTIIVTHKEYDEIITVKKSKKLRSENSTEVTSGVTVPVINT
jgi:hypothetical protein